MTSGTVISEPEMAIAAGRCLTARSLATPTRGAITVRHPRPCGWCDWPLEDLRRMVDGFNTWAGYVARANTYAHHELRVWQEKPAAEQEALIVAAQAFEDEPTAEAPGAMAGPAGAEAHAAPASELITAGTSEPELEATPTEEGPTWLLR